MLKHLDGFVMKTVQNNERGKREIEFYEQVFHSTNPIICQLSNLIPRFLGLHQFISDGLGKIWLLFDEIIWKSCSPENDSITLLLVVHYYIKMEDIAANFSKPCVADIKIGRQTWDPYSAPEKQLSEDVLNLSLNIRTWERNDIWHFLFRISTGAPKIVLGFAYLECVYMMWLLEKYSNWTRSTAEL